jgi:hypothetical protein
MNVFDLSDIESPDTTNHSKFVNSPDLVRLVGNRLASGQALTDSHPTVVDRFLATTANGVGSLETAFENAETPAEALRRNNPGMGDVLSGQTRNHEIPRLLGSGRRLLSQRVTRSQSAAPRESHATHRERSSLNRPG